MVVKVTIRTLESQNFTFEVPDDITVANFKEHIHETVGVSPQEQRLLYCGRVLQDDRKLADYDCHEKVMHMVRRPPPLNLDHDVPGNDRQRIDGEPSPRGNEDLLRTPGDGEILLSGMTLGFDGNLNNLVRQLMSFQQAINSRSFDGTSMASNASGAADADVDSRLVNLNNLVEAVRTQIISTSQGLNSIGHQYFNVPMPVPGPVEEESSNSDNSDEHGTIDGQHGSQNEPTTPISGQSNSYLARYTRLLTTTSYLQNFATNLMDRYRDALTRSRVGRTPSNLSDSLSSPNTPMDVQPTESEIEQERRMPEYLAIELRLLSRDMPRVLHSIAHIYHALSDITFNSANVSVDSVYNPRGRNSSQGSQRRNELGNQQNPSSSESNNRAEGGPVSERSVTITTTTVDTASTPPTVAFQRPRATATVTVTSSSGQAGIEVPISVPIVEYEPPSTPSAPPPTQEPSRATSASRLSDRGSAQQPPNSMDDASRRRSQESASTQTTRPISFIPGRLLPPQVDAYLACCSPLSIDQRDSYASSNPRHTGQPAEARLQFRVPQPPPPPPQTQPTAPLQQQQSPASSPQQQQQAPNRRHLMPDFSLTIHPPSRTSRQAQFPPMHANILDSVLRFSNPSNNSSSTHASDPILSMIPDLAVYTAGRIMGSLFLPNEPSPRPQAHDQQSSTNNQSRNVMDIGIDDGGQQTRSSGAQQRQQQAHSNNAASSQGASLSEGQIPSPSQRNTTLASDNTTVSNDDRYEWLRNCDPQRLIEVLRNHPDWLTTIEAELRSSNGANQQ